MEEFIFYIFKVFWAFIAISLFISYAISPRKTFGKISTHWHHSFDFATFSTEKIYNQIEEAIKARKIPSVSINRVTYPSGWISEPDRKYLQIVRNDMIILVCAAPIGNCFFISYWLGEPLSLFEDLMVRIPFIGKYLEKFFERRTFFQKDSEAMFLGVVKTAINQVVQDLSSQQGQRQESLPTTNTGDQIEYC